MGERDEMIGFMSRRIEEEGLGGREQYGKKSGEWFQKEEEEEEDLVGSTRSLEEEIEVIYEQHSQHFGNNGFDSEFMASASKFWAEKASLWQVCGFLFNLVDFDYVFFAEILDECV